MWILRGSELCVAFCLGVCSCVVALPLGLVCDLCSSKCAKSGLLWIPGLVSYFSGFLLPFCFGPRVDFALTLPRKMSTNCLDKKVVSKGDKQWEMAEMQMQCLKKALKTCLENCALTSLAHCSSAKLSTEQCASSDDGGVIKTITKETKTVVLELGQIQRRKLQLEFRRALHPPCFFSRFRCVTQVVVTCYLHDKGPKWSTFVTSKVVFFVRFRPFWTLILDPLKLKNSKLIQKWSKKFKGMLFLVSLGKVPNWAIFHLLTILDI